jgi:hypothetical protein
MPLTLTDGGGPGLHLKPLDATIGRLITLYRPSGLTGLHEKKQRKMHDVCWPFRWPWRCADTALRTSLDGGGPGLLRKPLVAATGRVLWPIGAIGHAKAGFFRFFRRRPAEKGARVTSRPLITIGV